MTTKRLNPLRFALPALAVVLALGALTLTAIGSIAAANTAALRHEQERARQSGCTAEDPCTWIYYDFKDAPADPAYPYSPGPSYTAADFDCTTDCNGTVTCVANTVTTVTFTDSNLNEDENQLEIGESLIDFVNMEPPFWSLKQCVYIVSPELRLDAEKRTAARLKVIDHMEEAQR